MLGDVLVTRNPCTHPGDLRVLTAVDRPELRHLVNVIVFSTLGERPNCQMMAGGDLDGDVYFVSWDRDLLKYLTPENMMEPASYVKPTVLKEKPFVPKVGTVDDGISNIMTGTLLAVLN